MAYLTLARFRGDPVELLAKYERASAVMPSVGREHGLLLHAAARDEGGILIVNLWPSKHESEAASRDPRRLRIIAELGIDPAGVRREHHEVVSWEVAAEH